jgi:hypothetical protein
LDWRIEEYVIYVRSLSDLSTLHGLFAEGATRGYILDDVCREEETEVEVFDRDICRDFGFWYCC